MVVRRPRPGPERPQHLCADKGYDYRDIRELIDAWGYVDHVCRRGETRCPKRTPKYRARRWVVERTHSWINRFRRLLIRWEKKTANYEALLHLACAWVAYRASGVLG